MKIKTIVSCFFIFIILTGCWDQRLLKDHNLILGIGYDINNEQKIIKTVTFPREIIGDPQQIAASTESEIISTKGDTVKDAEDKIDQFISGKFDRSKAEVILIGQDLAENGVFTTLDSIYRDLRGPLNASVAVVNGSAQNALNIDETYNQLTSAFYFDLLESANSNGIIKHENVQSICPVILSTGEDIVLPYISFQKNVDKIKLDGLALFSGDTMTGTLSLKEATTLLILSNQAPKRTKVNLQITDDKDKYDKNFVDFSIQQTKSKINIDTDGEDIKVSIDLKTKVEIDEYALDHLDDKPHVKTLSKQINEKMTKRAEKTIKKIQKANNDALKIGQQIRALHNDTWKKIDWNEIYPKIPIDVNFDIEIVRHGIIN